MKVRFQADADLNQTIILALLRHEPGIDFQTASNAGLAGLDDATVLALAAHEGRLLVTHDQSTMYILDFPAQGLRGLVTIRTAWIVARDTDFPRLVTCYVKKK